MSRSEKRRKRANRAQALYKVNSHVGASSFSLSTTNPLRVGTLQEILANPIVFVSATSLTFHDEAVMAPKDNLRKRVMVPVANETALQRTRRIATERIPYRWEDYSSVYAVKGTINVDGGLPALDEKATAVLAPPEFTSAKMQNRNYECYRNSLLQSLFHIPKFSNWLMFYHQPAASCTIGTVLQNCLACYLRRLLLQYWTANPDTKTQKGVRFGSLRPFLRYIQSNPPPSREPWQGKHDQNKTIQSDVMEFMEHMFELLQHQLVNQGHGEIFNGLFCIEVQEQLQCPVCNQKNNPIYVPAIELVLRPPPKVKKIGVRKLIENYVSPNSAENKVLGWTCPCGKKVDAGKTSVARAFPDILIVTIGRFESTGQHQTYKGSKNNCNVSIPEDLDLSQHLEGQVKNAAKYELTSVIHQRGSVDRGHYKMYGRMPNNSWQMCEDEDIQQSTYRQAVAQEEGWTPYVMFYKRLPQANRTKAMTTRIKEDLQAEEEDAEKMEVEAAAKAQLAAEEDLKKAMEKVEEAKLKLAEAKSRVEKAKSKAERKAKQKTSKAEEKAKQETSKAEEKVEEAGKQNSEAQKGKSKSVKRKPSNAEPDKPAKPAKRKK